MHEKVLLLNYLLIHFNHSLGNCSMKIINLVRGGRQLRLTYIYKIANNTEGSYEKMALMGITGFY